jgi:hypothetical protein
LVDHWHRFGRAAYNRLRRLNLDGRERAFVDGGAR